MKSFNQLYREHERKVKELHKKCPHKKSKWIFSGWADGHFDDFIVRMCVFCNKKLEEKTPTREEFASLLKINDQKVLQELMEKVHNQ